QSREFDPLPSGEGAAKRRVREQRVACAFPHPALRATLSRGERDTSPRLALLLDRFASRRNILFAQRGTHEKLQRAIHVGKPVRSRARSAFDRGCEEVGCEGRAVVYCCPRRREYRRNRWLDRAALGCSTR